MAALSRKHFNRVAKTLNDRYLRAETQETRDAVEVITRDLADMFATTNPYFNRSKFLNASIGKVY